MEIEGTTQETTLGDLIVALSEEAIWRFGDERKAYEYVACLLTNLLLQTGVPQRWH